MLGRGEKDLQEHERQNVHGKGWEDLAGQEERVGWGLKDTRRQTSLEDRHLTHVWEES